ncbi:sugar kinase [Paenibacillus sp.]|uniref:sugar kinase n=1 Tax=Paenibacillus sp. TaxID=58172 RepID=UPI002D27A8B0|nr:sugar kinase [Paenibacillus sp.]HZG85364.1 sugar kinase [Paenibacillus sp.]
MDVVTFGETMALLAPDSTGLMRYAHAFTRKFAGAESNVAIGLARLGHRSGWISRVGDDELGKALLAFVRGEGVDASRVRIDGEAPTGVFFKETRRAGDYRVYYYRRDSAASRMSAADLDETYLSEARYLYVSGITPALSDSCRDLTFRAVEAARRRGVKVVFDPNVRKKLWPESVARPVLLELAGMADIVLPGAAEGEFLFGEREPEKLGALFLAHGPAAVVVKLGSRGAYYATPRERGRVPGFPVDRVVDPIGAGDGFAAGLLSGLLDGLPLKESVRRANAVGAAVTMASGDVEGLPDRADLERFMERPAEEVTR